MKQTHDAFQTEKLDAIDERLYHLEHVTDLIGTMASQHGMDHQHTDGLSLEMFAGSFDWISKEVQSVREQLGSMREQRARQVHTTQGAEA